MVITINKNTKSEDITQTENKSLSHFYGKLKGVFGDGLAYQKAIRNEGSDFLEEYNKELDKSEADAGDSYSQDEVKKILADKKGKKFII